jgi:3-hydroxybutyrate dehydrogenase
VTVDSHGDSPSDQGRVAIVTGAGRGIGRATALVLVQAGIQVMAVSRSQSELASLADEAPVDYLVETVATAEGCKRIIDRTRERLGPISILVNNAGIGSWDDKPVWELSDAKWREYMAVNLEGPFQMTRHAIVDMIHRRWGRVVMVSSTAGEFAWPSMTGYCVSKHGVMGLMRAVAQDGAPFNITCNAVLPGWVRTAMSDRRAANEARRGGISIEEVWSAWAKEYPAGRVVTPDEVANTIAFLVSDAGSGISGEPVTITLGTNQN